MIVTVFQLNYLWMLKFSFHIIFTWNKNTNFLFIFPQAVTYVKTILSSQAAEKQAIG